MGQSQSNNGGSSTPTTRSLNRRQMRQNRNGGTRTTNSAAGTTTTTTTTTTGSTASGRTQPNGEGTSRRAFSRSSASNSSSSTTSFRRFHVGFRGSSASSNSSNSTAVARNLNVEQQSQQSARLRFLRNGGSSTPLVLSDEINEAPSSVAETAAASPTVEAAPKSNDADIDVGAIACNSSVHDINMDTTDTNNQNESGDDDILASEPLTPLSPPRRRMMVPLRSGSPVPTTLSPSPRPVRRVRRISHFQNNGNCVQSELISDDDDDDDGPPSLISMDEPSDEIVGTTGVASNTWHDAMQEADNDQGNRRGNSGTTGRLSSQLSSDDDDDDDDDDEYYEEEDEEAERAGARERADHEHRNRATLTPTSPFSRMLASLPSIPPGLVVGDSPVHNGRTTTTTLTSLETIRPILLTSSQSTSNRNSTRSALMPPGRLASEGESNGGDATTRARDRAVLYYGRSMDSMETGSNVSDMEENDATAAAHVNHADMDDDVDDDEEEEEHHKLLMKSYVHDEFYPKFSRNCEWMGRSIESLLLGHTARAPVLMLPDDDTDFDDAASDFFVFRRRSTASTFGGRRRSSHGSFPGGRRGSLSLTGNMHGGTLANYFSRRRHIPSDVDRSNNMSGNSNRDGAGARRGSTTTLSSSHAPMYRRRSSATSTGYDDQQHSNGNKQSRPGVSLGGPNVLLSLMARESTGKSCFAPGTPATQCLRAMGGGALYAALDKPSAGIASEVSFLAAAIDTGDWAETHTIVSRLVMRLIGEPGGGISGNSGTNPDGSPSSSRRPAIDDPNLPPTAPRYYAGGGRLGLERDTFVQSGGIELLIRIFREKSFVGQEMASSYDARDLSVELVANRLAPCWNEVLAALRELVYFMPTLVDDGALSDRGDFLPFLFTLLSHDSCFDATAALIEEILSFMSQTQQQQQQHPNSVSESGECSGVGAASAYYPVGRVSPATTFFLGNVPNLYSLWGSFNCRQLAHFCRILALLVFEPEDRQLLESPAVLKSLELLQLRRNRAARAGVDSTVDMNQAILLGDETLIKRLLMLLNVMNFAPPLRRFSPYHVLAHFPFIADTLVMLGLAELDNWDEIDRQIGLARALLGRNSEGSNSEEEPLLNELGAVADMLDGLSETLMGNNRQAQNQIGHIISVISAAHQAGVIVGRNRRSRRQQTARNGENDDDDNDEINVNNTNHIDALNPNLVGRDGDVAVNGTTIQSLASVAGILTDQILVRRLYESVDQEFDENGSVDSPMQMVGVGWGGAGGQLEDHRIEAYHVINTPEDAANSLQFNAMLLGPYQVEVLFVLCTLLGGRRKLDAQDSLNRMGIVPVLDDMFQRLPWYRRRSQSGEEAEAESTSPDQTQQPNGIHGPGCECTPESALCVQYLRLLHNFCDRDCDNYEGRRLLLSEAERDMIFGHENDGNINLHSFAREIRRLKNEPKPGLLAKIMDAFMRESDESPYRFWLASCIESYLRGSSPGEQMFAAQFGLLEHLVEDISSERLHCAGSLQTSFDLLGELSKGNADVIRVLVDDLDEERFRKLMSVAAANLVDSNVFIRSLLLSLERLSATQGLVPLYLDPITGGSHPKVWTSRSGPESRAYLTHSWWDSQAVSLKGLVSKDVTSIDSHDSARPSDWFPTLETAEETSMFLSSSQNGDVRPLAGLNESVGHFGWVFTPAGRNLTSLAYRPNTLERLSWFLAANQARLLRDLLGVVDLRNINHENICCLNTAVVIAIFAHRRQQLSPLLQELRQMNNEEKESKRRALNTAKQDDVVDRAFVQAMRYLDLEQQREPPPYARRALIGGTQQIGDRSDVMRNFREVLWFWMEYYTHRGRDRLSLEFSSHIRFHEWNHVVSLLAADDGSPTSLVRSPVRLPRSPYQRAARVADNPIRAVL